MNANKTDTLRRDAMQHSSPFERLSKGSKDALRLAARRKAGSARPISAATYLEVGADWIMVPVQGGERQVALRSYMDDKGRSGMAFSAFAI